MKNDEELAKVIVDSKMNILVNGCWEITADSLNYILRRKTGKKYIVDGYYSSLDELIEAIFEKHIKESEVKTLKSLLKSVKEARIEIAKACEEINRYVKDN